MAFNWEGYYSKKSPSDLFRELENDIQNNESIFHIERLKNHIKTRELNTEEQLLLDNYSTNEGQSSKYIVSSSTNLYAAGSKVGSLAWLLIFCFGASILIGLVTLQTKSLDTLQKLTLSRLIVSAIGLVGLVVLLFGIANDMKAAAKG